MICLVNKGYRCLVQHLSLNTSPDLKIGDSEPNKHRLNFPKLSLSRLERKIENIIADAGDSEDLIIEIINCFSPEEADNIFGKLDIRGKVFVDYQIGVYRIVLPTKPHEVCASEASDSLSRGADRVGLRRLISLTGASRTELWGFIPEVYNEFIDTNVAKSGRKTQKFKNMFTRSKKRKLAQPLERIGSNQIKNQLKKRTR